MKPNDQYIKLRKPRPAYSKKFAESRERCSCNYEQNCTFELEIPFENKANLSFVLFALLTLPLLKETTRVHLLAFNCQTMKSYWDKRFQYKSVYVAVIQLSQRNRRGVKWRKCNTNFGNVDFRTIEKELKGLFSLRPRRQNIGKTSKFVMHNQN